MQNGDERFVYTVVDGKARFQVLSPTMIRLEYAGDGAFQNATTFNAVNRSFARTSYTTTVTRDGYRVIRTGALRSACAALRPPKPPPMITTCGRFMPVSR
jgi:hypothetical protein